MKTGITLLAIIFGSCPFGSDLMAQNSRIATKTYVLHVHPLQSSISTQDTSGAPPDFVPVEKEPQIIYQSIPKYPESAQKAGIEGRVWVKIWIDKDGKPHQAVVMKSDEQIFDKPSVDAAMKYRFTPAIMNKKPVAVWVVIPFTFKLAPKSTSPENAVEVLRSGDSLATHAQSLSVKAEQLSSYANILSSMISMYNLGMRYESRREYAQAAASYSAFLHAAEVSMSKAEEMIRHAKEFVKEHLKGHNTGK